MSNPMEGAPEKKPHTEEGSVERGPEEEKQLDIEIEAEHQELTRGIEETELALASIDESALTETEQAAFAKMATTWEKIKHVGEWVVAGGTLLASGDYLYNMYGYLEQLHLDRAAGLLEPSAMASGTYALKMTLAVAAFAGVVGSVMWLLDIDKTRTGTEEERELKLMNRSAPKGMNPDF